jgi:hypothetical protein
MKKREGARKESKREVWAFGDNNFLLPVLESTSFSHCVTGDIALKKENFILLYNKTNKYL